MLRDDFTLWRKDGSPAMEVLHRGQPFPNNEPMILVTFYYSGKNLAKISATQELNKATYETFKDMGIATLFVEKGIGINCAYGIYPGSLPKLMDTVYTLCEKLGLDFSNVTFVVQPEIHIDACAMLGKPSTINITK